MAYTTARRESLLREWKNRAKDIPAGGLVAEVATLVENLKGIKDVRQVPIYHDSKEKQKQRVTPTCFSTRLINVNGRTWRIHRVRHEAPKSPGTVAASCLVNLCGNVRGIVGDIILIRIPGFAHAEYALDAASVTRIARGRVSFHIRLPLGDRLRKGWSQKSNFSQFSTLQRLVN